MKSSNKSVLPVFILVAIILTPLIFILGIAVGNEIKMNTVLSADSLTSWISAIATVAISVLTFILAKETWFLRLAQIAQMNEIRKENIQPNIGIQISSSRHALNLMNVKVSNKGRGIAKNIVFRFIDRNGKKLDRNNAVIDSFFQLNIFRNGISTLGIEQEFNSFLFSFLEIGNDIFDTYFILEVKFSDVADNQYKNEYIFDFSEYKGIRDIGTDPLCQMAKDLEKMQKFFTGLSGNKRINVNHFDNEDRMKERFEFEEQIERLRAEREENT
ncbi:hypothetical protein C0W93_20895 [Photobacterium leiognathi subsp. mandapamensis]|uniref:Uncharacterized protein n=2 Tax=Photobacterium leiognathi TaxID=553611 RepID=A0A2T3M5A2_PHOLE|nr:hypothetical protein [Photobacterium leiognathi]KJF94329.1 hypothetical protein UB34_19215 [Photobacterium leiognathi]PSV06134.1 hypothetical protein C0W93_20895 [Photobacterium leiognathi subsp. mandapamensis]PSV87065.1 hypothetical protein CTM89_19215 [Photobacterium leiognathi]